MSTIRRHGVAFHLIPTLGEHLWLEVIRESDGAVLASEDFRGSGDEGLATAADEWFDHIVLDRINEISVSTCRNCENRRRPEPEHDDRSTSRDYLTERQFDLCMACAAHLERTVPWMRGFLEEWHGLSDR